VSWQLVGRTLRLAFLLRVPLLTLALLAVFGPISRSSPLLENLFDQGRNPLDAGMVSFAAFMLAFTAIATLNLTLHYGSERLDEHRTVRMSSRRPLLTFVLGSAAAAIFVLSVVVRTEANPFTTLLATAIGALAAMALVVIAKIIQLALTDPIGTPHPPPFLVFPVYLMPRVERLFDAVYCWSSPRSRRVKSYFNAAGQWPLRLLRAAGEGYFVDLNPPRGMPLKLRSGHVFALTLSVFAFAIYIGLGLAKRHITAGVAVVPALAYLLLFMIVACWALSALAFFFDRYRFPLFTVIAALALLTAQAPKSDHFFRVENRNVTSVPFRTAAQYVAARARAAKHGRLVFVATPGGGIQAAAWTAQVLSKLDERTPDDGFRRAVGMISSVSGGSLGAMIYAASFTGQVPRTAVIPNSRAAAIDEVAWGWTFADFWRSAAPWFGNRTMDRGRALEDKWGAINNLHGDSDTLLTDWAARGATMPALIFNSMLVEPGMHIVFSTADFPRRDGARGIGNFYDVYPESARSYDLRVTTAARLSASFPFVAPASRPNLESMYVGDYHFVDGGYYDNYGIDSLIGWLEDAFEEGANERVKDILILTIQHFNAGDPIKLPVRGWGFQLYAPLGGLLSMWTAAPAQRDVNEFDQFARHFTASGQRRIWIANIEYRGSGPCARAPLSWKLSESQQTCIDDAWASALAAQASQLACIDRYLRGAEAPKCQYPRTRLW
jgi:hypothetical protein